jgi:hypothetical protein
LPDRPSGATALTRFLLDLKKESRRDLLFFQKPGCFHEWLSCGSGIWEFGNSNYCNPVIHCHLNLPQGSKSILAIRAECSGKLWRVQHPPVPSTHVNILRYISIPIPLKPIITNSFFSFTFTLSQVKVIYVKCECPGGSHLRQ